MIRMGFSVHYNWVEIQNLEIYALRNIDSFDEQMTGVSCEPINHLIVFFLGRVYARKTSLSAPVIQY